MMRIRPTVCLLVICSAMLLALPARAAIIYNNGPINGTIGSIDIAAPAPRVFDSVTVSSGGMTLLGFTFGAWLQPGDVLQTVSFEMYTGPVQTGLEIISANVAVTQSNCTMNEFDLAVCLETVSFPGGPTLPVGTAWLDIYNSTHLNVGGPVGWDINNGVGCTSPGCPSQAVDDNGFPLQSSSFAIDAGVGQQPTPEPWSLALMATGAAGLARVIRRR